MCQYILRRMRQLIDILLYRKKCWFGHILHNIHSSKRNIRNYIDFVIV